MIRKLQSYWRGLVDVREGEYLRTLFMSLYMLLILAAYYVLRPVSRALFLKKFDIDKLPSLYILIAVVGGIIAFLYSKVAVKWSLKVAVTGTMVWAVACLGSIWWLLQFNFSWMLFVFEIWVKVFSIVLVSQGWLVAANVFTSREAKRLYGILGISSVVGAAFGGSFTALVIEAVGIRNLLLASGVILFGAWSMFLAAISQSGVSLAGAAAAEDESEGFSFGDIVSAVRSHRHLQVIVGIISLTYIVDVMVEYQWNAMANQAYKNTSELAAYMATFQGLYTNIASFLLFLLTAVVVARFGVGGTLLIMPATITAASLAVYAAPSVLATSMARLLEASMRYSFNRTGMELLYLPLPVDLKNRTKAFVDVFVDRMARGAGGLLLAVLTGIAGLGVREISLVVAGFGGLSILLCLRARKEYVATVRARITARRLDLESARITVNDPAMIGVLEEAARGPHPRQVAYSLSLLAQAPGYQITPLLDQLVHHADAGVRAKVFELARAAGHAALLDAALEEIRSRRPDSRQAVDQAVRFAMAVSPDPNELAMRLLNHPNPAVPLGAIDVLAQNPVAARAILALDWISAAAGDSNPGRRQLAASALGARREEGSPVLLRLLADGDPGVTAAACEAAAAILDRSYVQPMVSRLGEARVRGAVIGSLAIFGPRIAGTLGDFLEDPATPMAVRRQIPRVLRHVTDQRSIDVLLRSIGMENLILRFNVIRSLNRLREDAPDLNYGADSVRRQILDEARYYYKMQAALAPFRDQRDPATPAGLLSRTIEARLKETIERLFRLLGLRYPQKEIYAAWLAVHRGSSLDHSAAVEFLDSVLDREMKRILMPLLDSAEHQALAGRDLFGLEARTAEEAVRELLESGDVWLVACAIATAAQFGLRSLGPRIRQLSEDGAGAEVVLVARAALSAVS